MNPGGKIRPAKSNEKRVLAGLRFPTVVVPAQTGEAPVIGTPFAERKQPLVDRRYVQRALVAHGHHLLGEFGGNLGIADDPVNRCDEFDILLANEIIERFHKKCLLPKPVLKNRRGEGTMETWG